MQAFLQPEQLDTTETWYCGRCKEHVQAQKKLDLWSLPELLVVHLKRFSYSRHSRDKLDAPVDFPLSGLDLSSFVLREQVIQTCSHSPVFLMYKKKTHPINGILGFRIRGYGSARFGKFATHPHQWHASNIDRGSPQQEPPSKLACFSVATSLLACARERTNATGPVCPAASAVEACFWYDG